MRRCGPLQWITPYWIKGGVHEMQTQCMHTSYRSDGCQTLIQKNYKITQNIGREEPSRQEPWTMGHTRNQDMSHEPWVGHEHLRQEARHILLLDRVDRKRQIMQKAQARGERKRQRSQSHRLRRAESKNHKTIKHTHENAHKITHILFLHSYRV